MVVIDLVSIVSAVMLAARMLTVAAVVALAVVLWFVHLKAH